MRLCIVCVAVVGVVALKNGPARAWDVQQAEDSMCRVTLPVKGYYGNDKLSAGPFGLWQTGTITFQPGGPGFVTSDGALGMKFGWTRGVDGNLKATGRRLDGEAPPLRLHAQPGYGTIGFQPSYLIFPTPGCWEVSAQLAEREDSRITFVTRIVKLANGPSWRLDP